MHHPHELLLRARRKCKSGCATYSVFLVLDAFDYLRTVVDSRPFRMFGCSAGTSVQLQLDSIEKVIPFIRSQSVQDHLRRSKCSFKDLKTSDGNPTVEIAWIIPWIPVALIYVIYIYTSV